MNRFGIAVVAFFSGMCCLIAEVAWSRHAHLLIGLSAHAIATVLAAFMLGLAFGSWRAGRFLDQGGDSGKLLRRLLAGIALCLALSPHCYDLLSKAIPELSRVAGMEGTARRLLGILMVLPALLVPTSLMGGLFPTLVSAFNRQRGDLGTRVGIVYALDTLGGAVGASLSGFLLIERIGLTRTLYLAAGICWALWAALQLYDVRGRERSQSAPRSRPTASAHPVPATSPLLFPVLLLVGISGFSGLACQVFWTRILTSFFRDSIYDLTVVLAMYLGGIAIGSLVAGRFTGSPCKAVPRLCLVGVLTGASVLAGLYFVDQFPFLINDLQTNTALAALHGEHFWTAAILRRCAYAFFLMGLPACLFGALFPMAARAIDAFDQNGRRLGAMNAASTLGAALGCLSASSILIPLAGLQGAIVLAASLNIGGGLFLAFKTRRSAPMWPVLGACTLSLTLALALPNWDRLRMSTSFLEQNQPLEQLLSLLYYREDASGVTSVVELLPLRRRYLVTNRLYGQNTSEMGGSEDHRRLGHIPLILHSAPKKALVIGLGAGITLRAVAEHPLQQIDCVETMPTVLEAARYFAAENARVWEDPRLRMILDDGRSFVAATTQTYDAIIMDITFPMSAGSGTLFSREHYANCRNRLRPGGLVCQWLPVHQLSRAELQTIVATFQSVFPNCSLWFGLVGETTAVVGLIGSEHPLIIAPEYLSGRLQQPSLAASLNEIDLGNARRFAANFINSGQALQRYANGAPLETDDRPVIEFLAPRIAIPASKQGYLNLMELSGLAAP